MISLAMIVSTHAEVDLARDGKPLADIVVSTNALASVKLAARDLQEYIEKMSGAKLEIVEAPSEKFKFHVYVGPGEYTKKLGVTVEDLKMEGFKIIVKDNYIVLIGRDEDQPKPPFEPGPVELKKWQEFAGEAYSMPPFGWVVNDKLGISPYDATATLYAVAEFLEQLGVRWYSPYEDGTVIPEKKTIAVAEQSFKKEPVFPVRHTTYYGAMRTDAEGVLWFKRLKYGCSYGVMIGHTTGDVLGWGSPEQKKAHPEYFAVVNGKTLTVPRLADESFRKSCLNFLSKTLEVYPYFMVVNMAPTDGFAGIDDRDAGKWLRRERGARDWASDYVWDFWLYIAKEMKRMHPDRYLRCNSYTPYGEPPSGVDALPDNVVICIAQNTATSFLDQEGHDQLRKKWISMLSSKKLFIYDYYLFHRNAQFPRYPVFFTKYLQEDMQALAGVGEGKFVETSPELGFYKGGRARLTCPGLTHMLHYWQGRLYWDPGMDRLKMLEEYYELYFGPARKEMKEFYEFAEEAWMRPESRRISAQGGFLKKEDVDRYFDILKRARERAGKDTVYDRRIARIEAEMQPLKKMLAGMIRTGPAFQGIGKQTGEPVKIDGNLEKKFWDKSLESTGGGSWPWFPMGDMVTGQAPDKNNTSVSFRIPRDGSNLVVGVVCHEGRIDKIRAKAAKDDDPAILEDDVIEIYFETPERSYFKIAVNPEGKIYDESQDVAIVERDTLPLLWNPGTKAAVRKDKYCWTAEISIPTADFGALGPTKDYPWGVNVCRTRRAGGEPEFYAIAPAGGTDCLDRSKWGNLMTK
jgi:hypothetical protein